MMMDLIIAVAFFFFFFQSFRRNVKYSHSILLNTKIIRHSVPTGVGGGAIHLLLLSKQAGTKLIAIVIYFILP